MFSGIEILCDNYWAIFWNTTLVIKKSVLRTNFITFLETGTILKSDRFCFVGLLVKCCSFIFHCMHYQPFRPFPPLINYNRTWTSYVFIEEKYIFILMYISGMLLILYLCLQYDSQFCLEEVRLVKCKFMQ